MTALALLDRARSFGDRLAIQHGERNLTYNDLLSASARLAGTLLGGAIDLRESRVAMLVGNGLDFAIVQWAIWRAGGVCVPLSGSAAQPELEYSLADSQTAAVVASRLQSAQIAPVCGKLGLPLVVFEDALDGSANEFPSIDPGRRAMILYTSGTTNKPKGVVATHGNVEAQIHSLVDAWEWRADDRIPLFLPLHHVHGIVNVLSCALWSGAKVDAFDGFEMPAILASVAEKRYTLFMAVPTIYVKLIQFLTAAPAAERQPIIEGFGAMRLMVSGSAALPASVHQQWTELTGQMLLERYGMTEIGMALSNPLRGERRAGSVGMPLPSVDVRLTSESGATIVAEHEPGEIQVRGPAVFLEYWNRPEATAESFDGKWFRTGDMAAVEGGYYRILGRMSVDIIKSGGYKLSALEIEDVLLQHPSVLQCAVVGLPDETWGEAVAAAIVTERGVAVDLLSLRDWCRDRLAAYKIPKQLRVVTELPRNAMGKVVKTAVREMLVLRNDGHADSSCSSGT